MREQFKAGVQYGDWEGTAAADDAYQTTLHNLLRERGLLGENDILIGIEAYIGENHHGKVEAPLISALIFRSNSPSHDIAIAQVKRADPVPVRRVMLPGLSLEEFKGLFKNFNIALSLKGFKFTNREYEVVEDVPAE
jgi:hypothetical protein